VDALVGVALEVAEDGDLARIADLLARICGVEDDLGAKVHVFPGLGEETQIDADLRFLQDFVD